MVYLSISHPHDGASGTEVDCYSTEYLNTGTSSSVTAVGGME